MMMQQQSRESLRHPFSKFSTYLILATVALAFALAGCASDKSGDSSAKKGEQPTTATVNVQMSFPFDPYALSAGTLADVDGVSVVVTVANTPFGGGAVVLAETCLTESSLNANDWSGSLSGLPVDQSLDFAAKAWDVVCSPPTTGNVVFDNFTAPADIALATKTLTLAGPNDIVFSMVAKDDGVPLSLPVIAAATIPVEIGITTLDNAFSFDVTHTGNVDYAASVTGGTIDDFASTAGGASVGGTGVILGVGDDISLFYDAPSTVGVRTLTFIVNDSVVTDVTTGMIFPLNIVSESSGSTTVFGPMITGFSFLRGADTLQFTAAVTAGTGAVSDPGGYAWTFPDPTVLPGTGSSETVTFHNGNAGDVKVLVTDSNGVKAVLTHTITAGDFQYTIGPTVSGITPTDLGAGSLKLDANVIVQATIGTNAYTWSVANPTGGFPLTIAGTTASVTITGLVSGASGDVTVSVTDDNGLTSPAMTPVPVTYP